MNEESPLEIIVRDPGLSPMQRLWGAVILRAVEDLAGEDPGAGRFFKDRKSNFETACFFLGWDSGRIRKLIERFAEQGGRRTFGECRRVSRPPCLRRYGKWRSKRNRKRQAKG